MLLCLAACPTARAQEVRFDFDTAAQAPPPASAAQAVPFDGGVLLGDVHTVAAATDTAVAEYVLQGAVGFVLPDGHPGGVLRLEFAAPPEAPAAVALRQFPLKLNPETVTLDGSPVEIFMAPGRMYQFMQPADPELPATLRLSRIVFESGVELSEPATCGCLQIAPDTGPSL